MRRAVFRAGGLLLAFGVLGVFSICQGETWQLKFMPEVPKASEADGKKYPQAYYFRGSPQHFSSNFNSLQKQVDPKQDPQLKEFYETVKKEPTYVSPKPLRGMIKFGDQRFAFAMDAVSKEEPKEETATEEKSAEKSEEKAEAKKELTEAEKQKAERDKQMAEIQKTVPNRIYLDLNANGDLTDDEPVEAASVRAYAPEYAQASFTATLPVEKDGQKFDVPCSFSVYTNTGNQITRTPDGKEQKIKIHYTGASFYTSCFCEGEVKLNDKEYRVFLIDYNNNGVFNDTSELYEVNRYRGPNDLVKENYVQSGDILYVVPADLEGRPRFAYPSRPGGKGEVNPLSVGSLIGSIDGQFWNMEVTPLGDKLTLTPSTESLGYVENPGKQFTLSAFNKDKKASMLLVSDEAGKAALPPGQWILTAYSMTFKKEEPKAEKSDEENADTAEAEKSAQEEVAKKVADFLTGKKKPPQAQDATVMARMPGTEDANITVKADETTTLKFGAPYKVVVNSYVNGGEGKQTAQLSLDLIGALGESCADVRLGTGRPPKPTYVISTKDGKEVESGAFEYG